jgi:thiazole synthase ThiGH ThiG subunit
MRPLGLGAGAFDDKMIDLSVVISSLPLVIEISVGASSDCKNCVMSGKAIVLLRRLIDL